MNVSILNLKVTKNNKTKKSYAKCKKTLAKYASDKGLVSRISKELQKLMEKDVNSSIKNEFLTLIDISQKKTSQRESKHKKVVQHHSLSHKSKPQSGTSSVQSE